MLSETIGIDVFHVRYRQLRRQLIGTIIREKIYGEDIQTMVRDFASKNIPAEDSIAFIQNVLKELTTLESFKIVGMGISEKEFSAWQKKQNSSPL